jgi:hypothetical protein
MSESQIGYTAAYFSLADAITTHTSIHYYEDQGKQVLDMVRFSCADSQSRLSIPVRFSLAWFSSIIMYHVVFVYIKNCILWTPIVFNSSLRYEFGVKTKTINL